jgi:serine/threonine-protein kinase
VICLGPPCTDVVDNGESLGPSPIYRREVRPGTHSLRLRRGSSEQVVTTQTVKDKTTVVRMAP